MSVLVPRSGGVAPDSIGAQTHGTAGHHNDGVAIAAADARIISYLGVLGRSVEEALRARRALLAELLSLRDDPDSALDRAGRASRRCVRAFDDALTRLQRTPPPDGAAECTRELSGWLEAHLEACDLLARAAAARDADDLRRALRVLTEGGLHAVVFNRARQRLVSRLAEAS